MLVYPLKKTMVLQHTILCVQTTLVVKSTIDLFTQSMNSFDFLHAGKCFLQILDCIHTDKTMFLKFGQFYFPRRLFPTNKPGLFSGVLRLKHYKYRTTCGYSDGIH